MFELGGIDSGPTWLQIAQDGSLSGKPHHSDVSAEVKFTVQATEDSSGRFNQCQLNISVLDTYTGELGLSDLAGLAAHWLETGCVDIPPCGRLDE